MMHKTIKIYCEGTKRSHDYEILHKIMDDKPVLIQPIGSKKEANSNIEFHEKNAVVKRAFLFFRDRDFDVTVPEKPSLIRDGFIFYSYRTTIENYLLDINHFFEFLKLRKLQKKYKIHNIDKVQNLFIKAAKKISFYQALRHTLGKMNLPDEIRTTWMTKGSGQLPRYIDDKSYCRQKALDRIKNAEFQEDNWTEQTFDAILNTFFNRFEQDDFYQNAEYLIWFQGKDLAKALCLFLPDFPIQSYYRFAKTRFDFNQFDDLKELRQLVHEMSATASQ